MEQKQNQKMYEMPEFCCALFILTDDDTFHHNCFVTYSQKLVTQIIN